MPQADYTHRNTDGKIDERNGKTIKFVIYAMDDNDKLTEHEGYLLTRENEDKSLYDFRVQAGKQGGTWAWIDRWSRQMSTRLHAGESLFEICKEEMHQRYEPSGGTSIPGIAQCDSPTDLVCKILLKHYAVDAWAEYNKGKGVKP
jgi:hypothetical protein